MRNKFEYLLPKAANKKFRLSGLNFLFLDVEESFRFLVPNTHSAQAQPERLSTPANKIKLFQQSKLDYFSNSSREKPALEQMLESSFSEKMLFV